MLDLKRLRVLREVAARGSFSGAADALSYTQSAVSQQIAALEREAGTRLVERNPRGIRLTDAGEALVRHTDTIVMRAARPADVGALDRLAQLDSSAPVAQPALVAEVEGHLRAALPIAGGRAVADPFERTTEVVALLEARAARLRGHDSRRERGLRLLRRRGAAAVAGRP